MIGKLAKFYKLWRKLQLSEDELEDLRNKKLVNLIRHSYSHVPYYKKLFDSVELRPDDIQSVEDLYLIPASTKNDLLKAGYNDLISQRANRSTLVHRHTSGSTGDPFSVYMSPDESKLRRQIDFRSLIAAGFKPGDRLVVLGPSIPFKKTKYHYFGIFSTDVIPPSLPIDEQLKALKMIQPTWLWSYPTILNALLHHTDHKLEEYCRPKVIVTAAEVFKPSLAAGLSRCFEYEHLNFYGAIETGRIAWECPEHNGLHVNSDHIALEVYPHEQYKLYEQQAFGETIVTTLNSYTMPFIRYRLGDLSSYLPGTCSCGRIFPLIIAPIGRTRDIIKLPSGSARSPVGISHILRDLEYIKHYQIVQNRSDCLIVSLVAHKKISGRTIDMLRKQILEFLGEPINIQIKIVHFVDSQQRKERDFISLIK